MSNVTKNPPRVTTKNRGRVTTTLETIGESYRRANPGMDCRWVYHPEHKPELSNVMSRRASGYKPVLFKELGEVPEGMNPDEVVRVADVILMSIDEGSRLELQQETANAAAEQTRSIDSAFYQSIEDIEIGNASAKAKPRAIGRSTIEEREFTFDVKQRDGEE